MNDKTANKGLILQSSDTRLGFADSTSPLQIRKLGIFILHSLLSIPSPAFHLSPRIHITESTLDMLRQTTARDVRQTQCPVGEVATWFAHPGLLDCVSGLPIAPQKDQMAPSSFSNVPAAFSDVRAEEAGISPLYILNFIHFILFNKILYNLS